MRNMHTLLVLSLFGLNTSFLATEPLSSQVDRARGRPVVLFIHGRAQAGRTQDEMVREWFGAFRDGLDKLGRRQMLLDSDLSLVRYEWIYERDYRATAACNLRPLQAPLALNSPLLVPAHGMVSVLPGGRRASFSATQDERFALAQLTSQRLELRHLINIERLFAADALEASGRLNRILNRLSERAARFRGSARLGTNFLQDTRTYLSGGQHHCDTNKVLQDSLTRIRTAGRPVVVVAHSMGGMVLFSHLHENSQAPYSLHLVSVGSQLGVPDLLPMIFGSGVQRAILPRQIVSWSNFSGTHDYIGFDIDRNAFLTHGLVPFGNYRVDTGDRNPHAISEYLQHRGVTRGILRAWCGAFAPPATRPAGCGNL
jgi:hypothetical protein